MATAQDIMTANLITIKGDMPVRDAIKLMLENRISGIPVVKEDMSLIGVLSEKDLLQLVFYDNIDEVEVGELMTDKVVTAKKDANLLDVCELLMKNNYKRIPIVTDNKLVGIISRKDMLKYILNS